MTARIEMAGRQFGRWTVVGYAGGQKWQCRCACGTVSDVDGKSLRKGESTGCAECRANVGNRKHGGHGSRLHTIWSRMIGRCENTKDAAFSRYGGRGVRVCVEWRRDFAAFRAWALANGYRDDLTIDRFPDNDGDYEPGNCRWATYKQQNRNRRDNRPVQYRGRVVLLSELAEEAGLPADVVKNRVRRYGWTIDAALTIPVLQKGARA